MTANFRQGDDEETCAAPEMRNCPSIHRHHVSMALSGNHGIQASVIPSTTQSARYNAYTVPTGLAVSRVLLISANETVSLPTSAKGPLFEARYCF